MVKTVICNARPEVLTAVVMKSSIFWDIKLCSPLKYNRRFGGTCRLLPQSIRITQGTRNQHKSKWQAEIHVGFLLALFIDPEDGGDIFLQNVG
jgi:hypothetical protein